MAKTKCKYLRAHFAPRKQQALQPQSTGGAIRGWMEYGGETGGQTDCGRDTSQHANSVWEASVGLSKNARPGAATTDAIIYGHCKFSFDNGGGYGGAASSTMMALQILTATMGSPDRRQDSFRSGTDLIAVISIFWHFWMAHKVTAAPPRFSSAC